MSRPLANGASKTNSAKEQQQVLRGDSWLRGAEFTPISPSERPVRTLLLRSGCPVVPGGARSAVMGDGVAVVAVISLTSRLSLAFPLPA